MMIIVTKPGIIIDVVGSYFYEKIMTENGLFVLGGPETQLHDILWAVHDGKNCGRSEGEENFRELPIYGGRLGAERCAFLLYTYARVCEALDLTEPERGIGL